ncbi:MAG TPA: PH domain-containing protein [Vicinamibacterales bacterium]|nr:PH domain-containing protein [Vicinamibacterales bacterium]
MPSEQRLHPASLLFDLVRHLRAFALPALLVFFGTQSSGAGDGRFGRLPTGWEVWLLLFLVPAVAASIVRYLTFRLHYAGRELVIRSGLLFRSERHIPFANIQNLDAVQNAVHRVLGVIEIRVQTGGGIGDEARLRVVRREVLDDMRRRVFEGRGPGAADSAETPIRAAADDSTATLLHLPIREVLLCGLLENRGMVIVGAAYGFAWESGLLNGMWDRLFGEETYGRGLFRSLIGGLFGGRGLPPAAVAVVLTGIAGALVLVRVLSMVWALVRLYDFRLSRTGEDLRTEYGLITRVTATIPIRRVQTVTIRQPPLHRWLARASVRVETAGRGAEAGGPWLAPLVRVTELPGLLHHIAPGVDMEGVAWQRVHPRALRRAVKPRLAIAGLTTVASAFALGWSAIVVLLISVGWAVVAARQYVRHLGWAEHDEGVLIRTGWLWRHVTLARANKIQSVSLRESPFDRRHGMASVRVDTAGAGVTSHRVDIPYLDRGVAARLAERLAAQAASTEFRW